MNYRWLKNTETKALQKKLLIKVFEEAKHIEAWEVRLVVNHANTYARRLCRSLSFDEKPAVFFEKTLRNCANIKVFY